MSAEFHPASRQRFLRVVAPEDRRESLLADLEAGATGIVRRIGPAPGAGTGAERSVPFRTGPTAAPYISSLTQHDGGGMQQASTRFQKYVDDCRSALAGTYITPHPTIQPLGVAAVPSVAAPTAMVGVIEGVSSWSRCPFPDAWQDSYTSVPRMEGLGKDIAGRFPRRRRLEAPARQVLRRLACLRH